MKTNTNENSGLKNRIAQHGEGKLQNIDLGKRQRNRALNTRSLLALMRREAPDFFNLAEVVGKWVWIQFDCEQPREITAALSEYGFHWNNRRQLWQHPCGMVQPSRSFDPRRKFRTYFPADFQNA